MRFLLRRFLLGHGPLKRTSDRLHALSRLFLLAATVATVPAAVATGTTMATSLHATADSQAMARHQESAILLADAPTADQATAGAPMGRAVPIWVDDAGNVTDPLLAASDVTAEAVVAATLIGVTLPMGATVLHLFAVRLIDFSRDRRWAAEWARSSRCGRAVRADPPRPPRPGCVPNRGASLHSEGWDGEQP
jgi:hypothetical protein